MKHRLALALTMALASAFGTKPNLVRADDSAMLAKLDAIEKRLAHIETMEQARGPKLPFALTLSNADAGKAGLLCQSLRYSRSMTGTAPGIPGGTTVVCYEP